MSEEPPKTKTVKVKKKAATDFEIKKIDDKHFHRSDEKY